MSIHFHKKPNQYVSHVQLNVSNLQRSIKYYEDIIGFHILDQKENIAYLTTDGKRRLISLVEVPHAIPLQQGQTGLYHFALLLPSRKDLGNFIQHVIDKNVQVGAGDHHVSEAMYLYDPDGNGIEVYADRPEEDWIWLNESTVHMVTEAVNFESILAEADGQWNGLPQTTVIGHIHLSAANLETTEPFYTKVLGYEVVARYGRQALFVSTGKYHHHIGFNTWQSAFGSVPSDHSVGLKSFTIVLNDEAKANEVKEKLKTLGAKIEHFSDAPNYGGNQLFSTIDPSGIRILFTLDEENTI